MGFLVKIDKDDKAILDKLAVNPSAVFGEPYGGYILFLAGGAEKEMLSWLSENMSILSRSKFAQPGLSNPGKIGDLAIPSERKLDLLSIPCLSSFKVHNTL